MMVLPFKKRMMKEDPGKPHKMEALMEMAQSRECVG